MKKTMSVKKAKTMGSKKSGWFMLLFGIPFLCAGIGVMWWACRMWQLYYESDAWTETPVTIVSTEFEVHRGDDSTSYSVDCSYKYTFNGNKYNGNRVGLEGGSGSSDSYHRTRYNILTRHRDNKTPFTALVDPEDPSRAILFRQLTTTLYVLPPFGLVFALAGLFVMSMGVRGVFISSRARAKLALHPDQPWKADKRWNTFELHSKPMAKIIGSFCMGLFLSLFMSIFIVAFVFDGGAPFFAKAIVGALCLAPICAFGTGFYHLFRYMKYGKPTLALTRMPCVIGEENTVLLYVRARIVAEEGIDATIKCMEKEWRKSGNKSTLSEVSVYSEDIKITDDMVRNSSTSSAIPITFTVPIGKHDTYDAEMPSYRWSIGVKAKTPGIDFGADFDIPVYNVSDPSLIEQNPRL
jgi:hypothetical protein